MSDDQVPPVMVAGRYQLMEQIAVGGMATVHRARDTVLDRPVAIKILHHQFASDQAFVARFRREAQAAARLGHAKVVAVYDWGPHDTTFYIAMELIGGRTLADELAQVGPLPIDTALDIADDVASALGAAHRQGTVHRDIKPSNIILEPSGGAKVADFGIARALQGHSEGDLTDAGSVIGTAGYLSPEQARGLPADPRSDLYSLGVVLFEMVTGRRPFVGPSSLAVLHQHIDHPPPSVRQLRPSAPADLEDLIHQLLSKRPDDRPPTAAALSQRLGAIRAGSQGTPPGTGSSDATAAVSVAADATPPGSAEVEPTSVVSSDATHEGSVRPVEGLPPTAVMPADLRPDARPAVPNRPSTRPEPRSRSGWPVVAGAVAIAAIVVGVLFASQAISGEGSDDGPDSTEAPGTATTAGPSPTEAPTAETVEVPDVRGESQDEATARIGGAGLVAVIATEELAADDDRVGRVISQSPEPGRELQPGQDVTIVVGVAAETTTTTEPPEAETSTTTATTSPPDTTETTEAPTTVTSSPDTATSATTSG